MNLKALVSTGTLPSIHPAGTLLLIAFLGSSWIFRRSFCSWLCPVGTVSEYLWRLGRKLLKRNFRIPRAVDIPLRGLKYLLLGFFVYLIFSMSVQSIRAFLDTPYGTVDDVKMLNLFRDPGIATAIVLAILLIGSLMVQNFWCRYFCPYGALMGLASLVSPSPDPKGSESVYRLRQILGKPVIAVLAAHAQRMLPDHPGKVVDKLDILVVNLKEAAGRVPEAGQIVG